MGWACRPVGTRDLQRHHLPGNKKAALLTTRSEGQHCAHYAQREVALCSLRAVIGEKCSPLIYMFDFSSRKHSVVMVMDLQMITCRSCCPDRLSCPGASGTHARQRDFPQDPMGVSRLYRWDPTRMHAWDDRATLKEFEAYVHTNSRS